MTDDRSDSQDPQGLLGALLSPLRAPQRIVTDIETISVALLSLQRDARDRLASVDEHAGTLVTEVRELQGPLKRLDGRVAELQKLEQTITERMDALNADLNERMLSVEAEVRSLRGPIEQMALDVSGVKALLPEPGDGPIARLKDTFTSS